MRRGGKLVQRGEGRELDEKRTVSEITQGINEKQ